jgi:integrase/recombinase XerD
MLEHFYRSPSHLHYLRTGPFGHEAETLASFVLARGYCAEYGRHLISFVDGFFRSAALCAPRAETYALKDAVEYADALAAHDHLALTKKTFLVTYLRERGLLKAESGVAQPNPILVEYEKFLLDVRGLRPSTIRMYCFGARAFLRWLEARGIQSIRSLKGKEVLCYVQEHATPSTAYRMTQELRSLLRYLHFSARTTGDFCAVVPRVPRWRLAALPTHLPWQRVRDFIATIDTTSATGKRDKAIVLLVAGLSLRNEDICGLQLRDLNWQAGTVLLRKGKSRKDRIMPLIMEIGSALEDYILNGRPRTAAEHVFLTAKAPLHPFANSACISSVVATRLRKAGVTGTRGAVNLLRHSLASHLVNKQVSIKDIADLFGHASINTTAIYTKVDHAALSSVALPFPKGRS